MAVRIAFGVLLLLATALAFTPFVQRWLRRRSALTVLEGLFVGSRLAGWACSYVLVQGLVRSSDLVLYYYPEALTAIQGNVPYRDFATSYGPFFPYLAGVGLPLWNAHAAVALVIIGVEVCAVLMFGRFARRLGDDDREATTFALYVYLVNPATLYWSGMLAYNSSIILFFWVLAVVLLYRRAYTASLLALGGSVLACKVLGFIAAPLWLVDSRRRMKGLVGLAIGSVVAIVLLRALGLDLLAPLGREGNRSTSGNMWFLMSALVPMSADAWLWRLGPPALLASGVGGLMVALRVRWTQPPSLGQFCGAIAAIGWLFMIASKKTLPHYTPMFILFTVFALARGRRDRQWVPVVAVLGAAGLLEPGLWNGLHQPVFLPQVCTPECSSGAELLIAANAVLIALSAYLCAACARVALARDAPARAPSPTL